MALANRVLGDDVKFEGIVTLPGEDAPCAVISQSFVEGRDATTEEQQAYFRAKGFVEHEGKFVHPTLGVTVWDTITNGNVIAKPDGTFQAIDLQIEPSTAEELRAAREQSGLGKDTVFSAENMGSSLENPDWFTSLKGHEMKGTNGLVEPTAREAERTIADVNASDSIGGFTLITEEELSSYPDGRLEAIQAAKRLANIFGRRIVVYRNERRPWIGGILNRDHAKIIFLNVDSQRPYWTVTGHELWHHIQINRPDLAKQVWEVLEPDLIDYERYKQARLKDGYTLDEVQNELIGDFLGDSMGDPHFWEKLANRQPSVFLEFAEAAREWLSKLVAAIKRHDFATDRYIRDIEGAQSVLADAISRFVSENTSKIGPREMADPNQNFYDHGRQNPSF